ncbi:helix-turn-helix transcriptional regulator [Streptomyces sp. NPDC050610]|uniref:helix-turn-helix domain-containing protein n=1 Tax=Streptomyces sp. NPDC050610 TaxID=3157097 RepID=UPI003412CBD9
MAAKVGPTIRRIQLGQELLRLREKAGLTLAQAVEEMPFDRTRLSKLENGQTRLRTGAQLRALLELYNVTSDEDQDFLLELHADSLSREWWSPYRSVMPSGMTLYLGLESGARSMRSYNPDVVPGLLQCKSYAKAQFTIAKPVEEFTTPFVEDQVDLRMGRKEVLVRSDSPLPLSAILDEAVLRRVMGSREVMREQYQQIEELSQLDHVAIQIMPLAATMYRSSENFTLLEFDSPVPDVVQVDGLEQIKVTDKKSVIGKYTRRFDDMRAGALPPSETPKILKQLAREMK